jgi:hypothetical protein
MLGFRQHVAPIDIPFSLAQLQLPTLLIGVLTCVLILRGARITKIIPPTILGLIGGVIAYYLFAATGFAAHLSPTLRTIPFAWPKCALLR